MGEHDEMARASARLGTVLRGKYKLTRVLGVGGMAAVYTATHRNGMEVAVKILHRELTAHEEIRARFLREGLAANALKHPGVVLVIDDDVDEDGSTFLVMELLHGQTLEELWEQSALRLELDTVLALGFHLCDVLQAAHTNGIIHRDIKPANLFLTRNGQLKVLDFGIARLREGSIRLDETSSGTMLGTPAFMAPEQASGQTERVSAATDVFAVGATLFTLASGHQVHLGDTSNQLIIHAATTPARSLASVMPGIHPEIAKIVDRALAFDPAERWQTVAEMGEAIRKLYTSLFGSLPTLIRRPPSVGVILSSGQGLLLRAGSTTTASPVSFARAPTESSAMLPSAEIDSHARIQRQTVSRRRQVQAAAFAALSLLIVVGLARGWRAKEATTASSAPAPSLQEAAAPPATEVHLASVAADHGDAGAATPMLSAAPAAVTATVPTAMTTPTKNAPARGATPRGPDCTVPYTIDSHGARHWKLSCL